MRKLSKRLRRRSVDQDDDFKSSEHSGGEIDCDDLSDTQACCLGCICCFLFVIVFIILFIHCGLDRVRTKLNKQNGFITDGMSRKVVTPRSDYIQKLERYKIFYGDDPALEWAWCEADSYWNERGKIELSQDAEAQVMEATYELHNMALEAVDIITKDDTLLTLFGINRDLWPAIRKSWEKGQVDFQGRFDFAWDGVKPPKLLEYNADTPSLQLESGVLSDDWFRDTNYGRPEHQANYIDPAFENALRQTLDNCKSGQVQINGFLLDKQKIGLLTIPQDDENTAVMQYFEKKLLGYTGGKVIFPVNDLQLAYGKDYADGSDKYNAYWMSQKSSYYGMKTTYQPYDCLLNSYPKEWMITEQGEYVMKKYDWENLKSVEPFWKILLGNKVLLPMLWSMYPDHPNLLPAYFDEPRRDLGPERFNDLQVKNWVSKPIFGREGLGVFFSNNFTKKYGGDYQRGYNEFVHVTENNFGKSGEGQKLGSSIYQAEVDLPGAQGRIIQTSSWVIGGAPAGVIFREGKQGKHFEDGNPFLLHTVRGQTPKEFKFKHSRNQGNLRTKIYKENAFKTYIYRKYGGEATFNRMSSTMSNLGWTQWTSYKQMKDQVMAETQREKLCNEECQYYMRAKSEGVPFDNQAGRDFEGFYHVYGYQMGRTQFGHYSSMDYMGNVWFSVDSHGRIRRHSYASAGFARS